MTVHSKRTVGQTDKEPASAVEIGAPLQESVTKLQELIATPATVLERATIASGITERLCTLLQRPDCDTHAGEIAAFIHEHKKLLQEAMNLSSSTHFSLRTHNRELAAKCRIFTLALAGVEFVNVMDINGTISALDGSFFPNTREALERMLNIGKVYMISGDMQDKVLRDLFYPQGIISTVATSLATGDIYFGLSPSGRNFKNMCVITESGIRKLDFNPERQALQEYILSSGLSKDEVDTIKSKLRETLLSPENIAKLEETILKAGITSAAFKAGFVQDRPITPEIHSMTIALFSNLSKTDRERLNNPDAIEDEDERNAVITLIAYREKFLKEIDRFLPHRFQIGGVGSIDYVAADKGELAYQEVVVPRRSCLESKTRPLAIITYGDRTQDRFGNDSPMRSIAIHRKPEDPEIVVVNFECSGTITKRPLDLAGQTLLYTSTSAAHGGTAEAFHLACDAACLANFIFNNPHL